MKLTIIHLCVGHRPGQAYIGTWQMEPLPAATIAGLTPTDVTIKFYDDRLEAIPFNAPTDLVAISVETYTAKRAFQIAIEASRGCHLKGEFCAIQSAFSQSQTRRPTAEIIDEIQGVWPDRLAEPPQYLELAAL